MVFSNAVEGEISHVKSLLRHRSRIVNPYDCTALDKYRHLRNKTNPGSGTDLKVFLPVTSGSTVRWTFPVAGMVQPEGQSLYYDHLMDWQKTCTCAADNIWQCVCEVLVEDKVEGAAVTD